MKSLLILFLSVLVFCSNDIFSQTEQMNETIMKNQNYKLVLSLPINIATAKLNLMVEIPENFKRVENPPGTEMMEFIPANDQDANDWSEIITVMPYIGKRLKAKELLDMMISRMKLTATDFKMIKNDEKKFPLYEMSKCSMSYGSRSRDELLMVYVVSGLYDAAMVQYAVHLNNLKEEDAALKKMEQFFSTHVKVIDGSNDE